MTRQDCLPSLLGDVDKSIEKVAPKHICTGPTRAGKAGQGAQGTNQGRIFCQMYSLSSHFKIHYDPPWTNNIKPKLQLSLYKILHMWGWEIEHACSTIEKIEKNMKWLQCIMEEKICKNVLTLYFFRQQDMLIRSSSVSYIRARI